MEAAGFAVGIIALIGTFKECIDLFSYFTVARSLGRDYELLSIKLDVEKALLLQWAQRTNLLRPNYDRRLDDPTIRATIVQVVSGIRMLLSDTKSLQERYGMRELQPGDEAYSSVFGMGARRMSTFTKECGKLDILLRDFDKLDLRIRRHQVASCTMKARWAIRDKDKFGNLLQELSYFVSSLHSLVPDSNNNIRTMTEEDIRSVSDRKTVRLLPDAVVGRDDFLADIAENHRTKTCEDRILRCIWYRLIDDRRDALSPPNPQTFEWALDPSAVDLKWDNIACWLSSDSKMYWICGKAGSGKSTLMKYIYAHPETKRYLDCWAGETPLTIASFFFSYLGVEIQKSQEGLSRALLFKILDSDRSFIPNLLPNMWADAYDSDENITAPSSAELRQAFERMCQLPSKNRKFCIFIDGLDEYSGKPIDGVNSILKLAKNSNMKVIISSRPIQPCVQAFSRLPKLFLQDLTAGDIRIYVEQTIDTHSHMSLLRVKDSRQTNDLRTSLIEKASGVFLWVILACRSFREGLDNYDHLSDLQERINELPPELERLFQHMLSNIEPRYQNHATKLLRMCHQSQLTLTTQRLYTLGLALVDDYDLEPCHLPSAQSLIVNEIFFATPLERQRRNDEKYTQCMILEGRLRSHCFGLVEIKKPSSTSNQNCFCGYRLNSTEVHDEIIDSTVEFMHRTVFDFLSSTGTAELGSRTEDQDMFEPSIVLSCISLHLASLTLHSPMAHCHVQDVLVHSANTGIERCSQVQLILTRLQELLLIQGKWGFDTHSDGLHIYSKVDHRGMADIKVSETHLGLLLAIELGIIDFIRLYESMGSGMISNISLHIPLLSRVLERHLTKRVQQPLSVAYECDERDVEMVRYLIEHRCSPNEQFLDSEGIETTPWKELLMVYLYKNISTNANRTLPLVIDLFLEGGADLDQGAMLCMEAQKLAKVDGSLQRIHEGKRRFLEGVTKVEKSADLCGHLLQKIAAYKEKLPMEVSFTLTQENGGNSNRLPTQEQRLVPQLRTSWKRTRSLSPPRLDRRKMYKVNTDGYTDKND